ncbi:unnamed protein product [Lactuca saligna]|uniref:F-box domain-containing protein n=1 Tax=Lactuca saligna TaxID=75948 RepID=A0AA36E8N2_LACSI|nr:unnamed protein product [Lactuca saligna]
MKKSERPKASKREDGVDFISNMPDSILLLILSLLSFTEEVIQTSILSKRWRYLWTSIPSVDLFYRFNGDDEFKKDGFKEFVYWVLANRSVDLDCFRLGCFDHYTLSTVRRWIHMAVTKNVKQLHLMFYPEEETDHVEIPHCLMTCCSLEILGLNLSYRGLRLTNIIGFPALRHLRLTYVDFLGGTDVVKGFLESFPLLESLILISCFMNEFDLLYISCPKLKSLRIENENDELMCDSIKICCPKLVDLELRGLLANNFFVECLDSLNKAEIEPKLMGNITSVLLPGISHVEHLWIDLYFFSQCIYASRDSVLPNLKTLVLTTGIDAFTMDELIQILKCYPKVESLKLIVKEEFYGSEEWELHEGEARRLMTPDVKRVEFFEFKGERPKIDIDWDEVTFMEMVFSWGTKSQVLLV